MIRFPLSASGGLRLAGLFGALVAGVVSAQAADLGQPSVLDEAPKPGLVEVGTGWYLRGDVGYNQYGDANAAAIGLATVAFDAERLKNGAVVGAGFGYKFTNWFRTDLTLDYRQEAKFVATTSQSNYLLDFSQESAQFTAGTLLLNGYVDLGTWSGVTPYIGAGIGVAQTRLDSYNRINTFLAGSPGLPLGVTPPLVVTTRPDSSSQYNLAYAFMAGVAFDIDQFFKIDAGYRYVRFGDAETKLDAFGFGARLKDIDSHEFRVGVRFTIDGE